MFTFYIFARMWNPESSHLDVIKTTSSSYFVGKDIFDAIKENEKSFSRELKFNKEYDYDEKHKIWDQFNDQVWNDVRDVLDDVKVKASSILFSLVSEAVRNIADHGWDRWYVDIQYIIDESSGNVHFHFSVLDNGKGVDLETEEVWEIFTKDFINVPGWKEAGRENGWKGLWMIRDIAKVRNIDLRLHHRWDIVPINTLWLQPNLQPSDKFGYEGYGVLDMDI